jgi:DNA-binding Xre family transcriptional regulator
LTTDPKEGNKLKVLTNNIMTLLKAKNGGNVSDMQKHIRVTYKAAYEIAQGKNKMIRIEVLDALCEYFGVGPGEIFIYTPGTKS